MSHLSPEGFEAQLQRYVYERAEETHAVRVGAKTTSDHEGIVARHSGLFTAEQLDALRVAETAERDPTERERLHRLRRSCESGLSARRLAPLQDELTNAELGMRVDFRGEELPLRTAIARLRTLVEYADREELGARAMDASAELNSLRSALTRASEELRAELSGEPDPIRWVDEEKGISTRDLAEAAERASILTTEAYEHRRRHWLDLLLGPDRPDRPSWYHAGYVNRLSPLAAVYAKERAVDVCLATLQDIGLDLEGSGTRLDLEDRAQKTARPVVIASDPPRVVHLVMRPLGGRQDYQGFLHEAGHALHFAGTDPSLPFAFRRLSRDNALSEVYSHIVQAVMLEPGWHVRHLGLSDDRASEHADAIVFLDGYMFRRYAAKLQFEIDFWARFAEDGGTSEGYATRLTAATGFTTRDDRFLADMDPGFYSADYVRAWIRCAQLRSYLTKEIGPDWWCDRRTGSFLAGLFREGLRPSNEDIAARIGFAPLDVGPLLKEQAAATIGAQA